MTTACVIIGTPPPSRPLPCPVLAHSSKHLFIFPSSFPFLSSHFPFLAGHCSSCCSTYTIIVYVKQQEERGYKRCFLYYHLCLTKKVPSNSYLGHFLFPAQQFLHIPHASFSSYVRTFVARYYDFRRSISSR